MISLNRWIQGNLLLLKILLFPLCLAPFGVVLLGAFGLAGINLGAQTPLVVAAFAGQRGGFAPGHALLQHPAGA